MRLTKRLGSKNQVVLPAAASLEEGSVLQISVIKSASKHGRVAHAVVKLTSNNRITIPPDVLGAIKAVEGDYLDIVIPDTRRCAYCNKEHTEEYTLRYSSTYFHICSNECLLSFTISEMLVGENLDPEEFLALTKQIVADIEEDTDVDETQPLAALPHDRIRLEPEKLQKLVEIAGMGKIDRSRDQEDSA